MAIKLAFVIPFSLGIVLALAIGIKTGWSTDLWALPLIMGTILGISLHLALRRAQEGVTLFRKSSEILEDNSSSRAKLVIELILFASLLGGIAAPLSGERGVLVGDTQISTRTILLIGLALVGLNLVAEFFKYIQRNR
jgi:hypothetical protein